jgi:uncharacterized membrane protein YhaH (DUF805 family)
MDCDFWENGMIHNLFGFNGRIGRGVWWLAQVVAIPIIYLVGVGLLVGLVTANSAETPQDLNIVWGVSMIIVLTAAFITGVWINFSSMIQRYHDRGKSGFWSLILLIPIIGPIWVVIECGFCSGEDGSNQWGPPPGSGQRSSALAEEIAAMSLENDTATARTEGNYSTYTAPRPAMASQSGRPAFGKL